MHLHISGIDGIITALYVLVIIGALNLLAMKHKDTNRFWSAYANLYGIN